MSKAYLQVAAGCLALGGTALWVRRKVNAVERANPPAGRFVTVDGVRLHYIDVGQGPTLVLLHGLGSMVEDFMLSGLIRGASEHYRVIAFDRPGYGHSARPRRWRYGAFAQAHLFSKALRSLGVHRPIVLGHSWGALVAAALALEHPGTVRSLVLASGLYFPSLRLDTPLLVAPAIPVLGDLLRHTLSPLAGRALWPAWLKMIFAPAPVPASFERFPEWMALRPSQLYAVAEDALLTAPATFRLSRRYRDLKLPVVLVAGARDRYVNPWAHTRRLGKMLPARRVMVSPGSGHMVHHSDLPLVLDAVDTAAAPAA